MMTDAGNSYRVQQNKSPISSPIIHQSSQYNVVIKEEHLIHDYIEERPPSILSFNCKQTFSNSCKSSSSEQQQKEELLHSPTEHQQHPICNNVHQERIATSEASSHDIKRNDRALGVIGGDSDSGWNDPEDENDESPPGITTRMENVDSKVYLNSSNISANSNNLSRELSSPLPPPPPTHSYSRLSVPSLPQNPRARLSPTNWHQPRNQMDYIIQQQTSNHLIVSDELMPTQQNHVPSPPNAVGMLKHESEVLYITENCIEIGRNSSTSHVHFHVARNSFVSRKHFQVLYDPDSCDFYVACLSKNGVFVDDVFQRRYAEPMKLPKSCSFRFPSTEIRIMFESFVESTSTLQSTTVPTNPSTSNNSKMQYFSDRKNLNPTSMVGTNVIYSPLKISIPKTEQKSPYPSPTGTISAANSCPTSPRQGFQDYQSYSNYANNNNLQSQELFQTPSTSSYNDHEKPPYSYAQLIVQSISAAPDKQLTLSGIYSFISKHYPYYRKEANKGWQNSIRHNLSLNRYFIKVARSQDEPGKGSFWRIDPTSEAKLIDQSYKKRRQRGSQCFRPAYGMPRSAPVSPSHIDNSRESSPLHDIVLQSAPGSPGISYQGHLENHSAEDLIYNSQSSYNAHSKYNSSPYHISANNNSSGQQQSIIVANNGTCSNINGGGTLIAVKRHHPATVTSVQSINSENIPLHHGYDEIHGDIHECNTASGPTADSDDDCETIKRPKFAENNQ